MSEVRLQGLGRDLIAEEVLAEVERDERAVGAQAPTQRLHPEPPDLLSRPREDQYQHHRSYSVHGHLARKKTPSSRTLQQAYA